MSITFTETELKRAAKDPIVLRAIADWHDYDSTCADACNDEGVYDKLIASHDERAKELRAEADRIEAEQ